MSVTSTLRKTASVGGVSFSQAISLSAEGEIVYEVSINPGYAGELTTRTDNHEGYITVEDSGHSFDASALDRVDIYWTGGCGRGGQVSGVVGNVIHVTGLQGDNLPIQGTEVTLVEPTQLPLEVDGDLVVAMFLATDQRGQFTFMELPNTEAFSAEVGTGYVREWGSGYGEDNPLAGYQVDSVYVSHDGTALAVMRVGILHDSA